ncbi:hypothetical protein [Vibrio penaeicida]|uniref:Uncharacterized protein n=1 Tax=Vibrio penaeicida TaxID=104609 RepID=A0AAV5NZY4_9VIBR|nr:hypothetical protein [Vibrio penaeicida]GLQ75874.1 hypothetical protein GCM10007932_52370 [Vibrio penaeicida]
MDGMLEKCPLENREDASSIYPCHSKMPDISRPKATLYTLNGHDANCLELYTH